MEINSSSSAAPVLSACLRRRADTGVGVCAPRNVKLAEIRSGVSCPDRQREDSVSPWRHFPGTQLRVRPNFFFFLSLSELLKPTSWAWSEARWGRGSPAVPASLFTQTLTPACDHLLLPTTWSSGFTLAYWCAGHEKTEITFEVFQNQVPGPTLSPWRRHLMVIFHFRP